LDQSTGSLKTPDSPRNITSPLPSDNDSNSTHSTPLAFPDSDTPMADPSDDETPSTVRQTRSKRKSDKISDGSDVEDAVGPAKPAKKKPGPKPTAKRSPSLDITSDSELEPEVVTKKKKPAAKKRVKKPVKKAAKKKGKEAAETGTDGENILPDPVKIVFMIPEAQSEGNQRVRIESSATFEDVVEQIHEVIGCVSVPVKPKLAYWLSSSKVKDPSVNLRTADDWEGLTADVVAKINAKKDLTVTICVEPENYMFSLWAKNKKKKTPAVSKGKKGKMTTMDLDNDDPDGDDDDDDEAVADGERQAMSELDSEYKKCVKCGPAVLCKIDRSGSHVHLTFQQCRAWAVSLACKTIKVTKTTPPQSDMFSMFHGARKEENTAAPGSHSPYYPPPQWYPPPMPPLGYGMPGFPGYAAMLPAAEHRPMLSSDSPDDPIAYPSVIEFIESLVASAPQRYALRTLGETLDSLHLFDISEIKDLTVDQLGTEKFGKVVLGDAQYLLTKVVKEVKRLDKLAKRSRL
ncbi:hypothetical protein C8J57DRAFT_1372045, partial [Mycena rebaudengoi]